MSDFDNLGVAGKLALPISLKFWTCTEASLGSQDTILRTKAIGVFPMPGVNFLIESPA